MPLNKHLNLVVPLGCQDGLGTILQPCCRSPRQVELGGSRTLCSSQCSRCPCRITIPVQSFSNLQIRGEALPHCRKGEQDGGTNSGGFWGLCGRRSHLSCPCPIQRDQEVFL